MGVLAGSAALAVLIEQVRRGKDQGWLWRRLVPAALGLLWVRYLHVLANRQKRLAASGEDTSSGNGTVGRTVIGQGGFRFLLAFVAGWYDVVCFKQYKMYANMMTGNSLNMCMAIGNGQYGDASLLAAAIALFNSGFTGFEYFDRAVGSNGSCTAVAPVILGLFAMADKLRREQPQSRWHVLYLAVAGGIVNAVSASRAKIVTNMMTGHYQKLCGDVTDLLSKGTLGADQTASVFASLRAVFTFLSAVAIGAAAWKVDHPYPAISRHRFTVIGAIYAAVLVLHELPVDLARRKKRVEQGSGGAEPVILNPGRMTGQTYTL
uniref:Uncharacterized protein n=3 Tax=Hemiselmis andersenii TaxID=464988 RepID=A0A7S0U8H4_HEMAN|mmetsp:Transcript_42650/g.98612  ORF Transcript_42650/g.98612 Transcript_42650/m.98612 type:complete len:320 (+) Transcript_42650:61-1020(+)